MSAKNYHLVSKQHKKKQHSANPSANTIVYKGPMRTLKEANQAEVYTLYGALVTTLDSSVGGAINLSLGSWPSGITDWSNVQGTFHEVRTLGMKVKYCPNNKYNRGTVTTRPIMSCVDHTDSGTPGSYAQIGAHESNQIHTLDDTFSVTCKMSGTEEAEFQDTQTVAATGNRFYVKLYSDGLSFSTQYGIIVIEYRYQVRGRK